MAFISNQWLRGSPRRKRTHDPVRVHLSLSHVDDEWDREHDIALEIVAASGSGDYMLALVDSKEVEELTLRLIKEKGVAVHALNALASLSDPELIEFFGQVIAARKEQKD